MYWNSSDRWQHRRHRHNGWIVPVVIIGLIVLTHGWILLLPVMALAAFAFVGFVLPKVMFHMNQGGWQHGNWQNRDWSAMNEKRKQHFQSWNDRGWNPMQWDEKPKRDSRDDIEYV